MQILVRGSISLSGHLPAEMALRVFIQHFIWVFITRSKAHRLHNGAL